MGLSSGTYFLIEFRRFHFGNIENWTERKETIDQVVNCIEKTMRSVDKSSWTSWTGTGEDEITYSIFKVTTKRVFIDKKAPYDMQIRGES